MTNEQRPDRPHERTISKSVLTLGALSLLIAGTLAGCIGEGGTNKDQEEWKDWFLEGIEIPDGLHLCDPGGLSELWEGFETNPGQAQFYQEYGVYYQAFTPKPDVACDDGDGSDHHIAIRIDHDPRDIETGQTKVDRMKDSGYCDQWQGAGTEAAIQLIYDEGIQAVVSATTQAPADHPDHFEYKHQNEPEAEADRYRVFEALEKKNPEWLRPCPE